MTRRDTSAVTLTEQEPDGLYIDIGPSARVAAIAAMQGMKPRSHARIRQEERVKNLTTEELADEVGIPIRRLADNIVAGTREKMLHREMQRKARRRFGLVLITGFVSAFAAGLALGWLI